MQKINNLKEQFVSSFHELKNARTLVASAMLLAVAVVLGFFTLQVTDYIKLGFASIANELSALMFGPVVGSLVATLADIIKYIVKPTGAFFPGFTISAFLGGLIYGMMFYKKPLSFKRILAAKVVEAVFINILLNTYWLTILYGSAFSVLLPARIIKQIVMVPIEAVIFYSVAKALSKAKVFAGLGVKA
ncbi:MAG: folate family ECF transporter S component [Hespellia sp.]|nr:folate family ECF transporter S component [Hespellia sp.]